MAKMNFKERYAGAALITGASSGLGEIFAHKLAKRGMDLVLVARSKDKLEILSETLSKEHGIKASSIAVDLTKSDCSQKIKDSMQSQGIEIGMIVNNAGYGSHGKFQNLDLENELRMVDLNIRTPLALTGTFLPSMIKRGKGAFVFLSSIGSYQPTPFFANYGATKAWNLLFGEALWAEFRGQGIDTIALSPGFTRTKFQETAKVTVKPLVGWSRPEDVVERCLNKLGKKPSTIPGFMNWMLAWSIRFTPRRLTALVAYSAGKPPKII